VNPWHELQLEQTQWHDGLLGRVDTSVTEQGLEVTLEVEIFADPEIARHRHRLVVRLRRVRELALIGAGPELIENRLFGQIAFARLNDKASDLDLSVHLVGGYIRVVAAELEVTGSKASENL
jgi:hypothetical protein